MPYDSNGKWYDGPPQTMDGEGNPVEDAADVGVENIYVKPTNAAPVPEAIEPAPLPPPPPGMEEPLPDMARTPSATPAAAAPPVAIPSDLAGAMTETRAIEDKQVANMQAEAAVKTGMAQVAADEKTDRARIAGEKQAEQQEAARASKERIDNATRDMKAKQEAFEKMSPKDFYGEMDTGRRIASAIAVGLGGYAAGILGQRNSAQDIVDNAAKDFRQRELDKITQGKNGVELARDNMAAAESGKLSALKDVELKYAAVFDRAAEEWAAKLAQKGVPVAQIQTNKDILLLQQKGSEHREKLHAETKKEQLAAETRLTVAKTNQIGRVARRGGGGHGGAAKLAGDPADIWGGEHATDGQRKAAANLQAMQPEAEFLKSQPLSQKAARALYEDLALESAAEKYKTADYIAKLTGHRNDVISKLSPADQESLGAMRRWLEPLARQKSGSAIGAQEWKSFTEQYLPIAGEGEPSLRAKMVARDRYMRTIATIAGAPYEKILKAAQAPDSAPAKSVTRPAAAEAVNWAKAHPNDPRAKRILALHGV